MRETWAEMGAGNCSRATAAQKRTVDTCIFNLAKVSMNRQLMHYSIANISAAFFIVVFNAHALISYRSCMTAH